MNLKKQPTRLQRFAILAVLFILLSACAIPLSGRYTSQPTPQAAPTFIQDKLLPTTASDLPAAAPTSTLEVVTDPTRPAAVVVVPTSPSFATAVPVQTATEASQPQVTDPFLRTRGTAEARMGPGFNYDLSHTLGAGTQSPVQGRSPDGLWWAIPGPGDGPGPLGWIQAADADFFGDASSLPVLSPPSSGRTDVPIHSDPGSPPANACVAVPLGSDLGPVFVRLGPGEQFNVTYRLGGWAEVLKTEVGWHMVFLGPGEVGWVDANRVATSGPCS